MKRVLVLPVLVLVLLANFNQPTRSLSQCTAEREPLALFIAQVKSIYRSGWNINWPTQSAISQNEFSDLLVAYTEKLSQELEVGAWIAGKTWANGYVKKLLVDNASELFVHADYHGDIASLLAELKDLQEQGYLEKNNGFKIDSARHPNFYMFFLGDFIDRGAYGTEVLYTLLKLALANPTCVLLIKGNHETGTISPMQFPRELHSKFSASAAQQLATYFYTTLAPLFPDAVFVGAGTGTNRIFTLLCHAGPMAGDTKLYKNIQDLLASPDQVAYQQVPSIDIDKLLVASVNSQGASVPDLTQTRPNPHNSQYIWNDFSLDLTDKMFEKSSRGTGLSLSKAYTNAWFNLLKTPSIDVRYIVRGHQNAGHSDFGKKILEHNGIGMLWEKTPVFDKNMTTTLSPGCVCTFLVTPDTTYGKHDRTHHPYDVYGVVRPTADGKADWKIEAHQLSLQKIRELTGMHIV